MRAQWARRVLRGELVKELALHKRYDGSAPRLGDGLEDVYDLPPDPSQPAENQAPRAQTPLDQPENWPELKACIVGAGIAGLYTAMILDSLEIPSLTYEILESSDAPGGRVKTHYFPPEKGISHKHMYYDIGAMRFPKIPTMDR